MNGSNWKNGVTDEAQLIGEWRACGLREGLDMLREDGRLCYYPVGRGGITFLPGGVFRLTTVNAAGTLTREGRWSLNAGLVCVRMGEERGAYCADVACGRLTLAPERMLYRGESKRLHRPVFERTK